MIMPHPCCSKLEGKSAYNNNKNVQTSTLLFELGEIDITYMFRLILLFQ